MGSKPALHLVLSLALALLAGTAWPAPGIAVIVARDGPELQLDRAFLRDVYLKKIFVDQDGHELVPVNLPPDHPLRRAFADTVLHETGERLENYWNERYFHGVRPPYVLGSENAVLRFVAHTRGAIGYVASCRVDRRVREVLFLPVPPETQAAIARACHRPPGTPRP